MLRRISLLIAFSLAVSACSDSEPTATTAAGTVPVPTTTTTITTAPPSTSATTTTTTTTPPPVVAVTDAPPGLVDAINRVVRWTADTEQPAPSASPGLVSALAGTPPLTDGISGAAAVATVLESQIAVVTATQGLILAVDDGGGWRVVGLDLDELAEPYLGPAIRRLFIIGSDARPGQNVLGFRADSLHILTIVTATEEGALVGIPRDSWVETPSGGNRKFTNIMARNGPELIVETAELLTGLDFEGHIVTGFKGFADVINEFGTFLFDVPFGMAEPKSGAYFRSGEQEFDGDDALAFSRNRTISGGDFTRQLHGGLILLAILAEARMVGPELIPELLAQFTEHVFTDLSAEDLLTLAVAVYRLDPAMVPNLVVPGTVGSAGAASVVFLGDAAEAIFADLQDGTIDTDG